MSWQAFIEILDAFPLLKKILLTENILVCTNDGENDGCYCHFFNALVSINFGSKGDHWLNVQQA